MITATTTAKIAEIVKNNNTISNRKLLYSAFLKSTPGTPERARALKQMQFIVKAPVIVPAFKF